MGIEFVVRLHTIRCIQYILYYVYNIRVYCIHGLGVCIQDIQRAQSVQKYYSILSQIFMLGMYDIAYRDSYNEVTKLGLLAGCTCIHL